MRRPEIPPDPTPNPGDGPETHPPDPRGGFAPPPRNQVFARAIGHPETIAAADAAWRLLLLKVQHQTSHEEEH